MRVSEKTSYLIAFFATAIRYYDYALFGLSASVISSHFMPDGSNSDKLLNFFMIFSISVAARPIGSVIFGRISDTIGRVVSVKITTIISAFSALIISILPGYETIGLWATVVLTVCRMLFIMSLAGETDAIKIYIAEKIGKKSRHLASGLVSFSAQLGALIAACMYHFTLSVSEITWLWRINFAVGGILGISVFLLRKFLHESSHYIRNKTEDKGKEGTNIAKIISQNRLKFFLTMILNGGIGASYNFLVIFLSTFVAKVIGGTSIHEAAENNIILIIVYAISCLISGVLADRISIYKQIFISLLLTLSLLFVMQILSIDKLYFFSLHMLVVFFVPIYMIPIQIKLQSIFPVNIRVRMCSLGHSLGSMILSSTIPFFCMLLWKYTENFSMIYIYFMVIVLLIIGVVFVLMKESYKNMFEI